MISGKLTVARVKELNRESGGKFFSLENRRFCKTRFVSSIYHIDNKVFFIISEKLDFHSENRQFKVCEFNRETYGIKSIQAGIKTIERARLVARGHIC